MSSVASIVPLHDETLIASKLDEVAAQLRAGVLTADRVVIMLADNRIGTTSQHRASVASLRSSEWLGMIETAKLHVWRDDFDV